MKLTSIATIACLLPAAAGIAWSGERYLALRANVQEELKLSYDQKQTLREKLPDYLQLQKTMQAPAAVFRERLFVFLKETMNAEQFKRFQQVELQHEGPPALLRPEIVKELQITDEQRNQFIGVVHDMQKRMEPLMKELGSGGNPGEIRPKAIQIYADQEGKIEAILSDKQRKQWKELYGKPFYELFNQD